MFKDILCFANLLHEAMVNWFTGKIHVNVEFKTSKHVKNSHDCTPSRIFQENNNLTAEHNHLLLLGFNEKTADASLNQTYCFDLQFWQLCQHHNSPVIIYYAINNVNAIISQFIQHVCRIGVQLHVPAAVHVHE